MKAETTCRPLLPARALSRLRGLACFWGWPLREIKGLAKAQATQVRFLPNTGKPGRAAWLLKPRLEEMGIAFHVLVQDRYVRIFEVTTDINVGLDLTVRAQGCFEALVGGDEVGRHGEELLRGGA